MNMTQLPETMRKTAVAQAMEGLEFSAGSPSQQSQSSQSEKAHDYSHLERYTQSVKSETESELAGGEVAEEMTEEDTNAIAGYCVSAAADFVESLIEAPVTIDNDTRAVIAEKAAPVVAKYCKNGNLPPWFVKWKEEIELGLVLGTAALSVYKQIREYDKENSKGGNQEVRGELAHGN